MKKLYVITLLSILTLSLRPATAIDYSNWMTTNYDKLANKPLNQLLLLGSHDSGTYNIQANSPFCRGEAIAGRISINFEYLEDGQQKVNWARTQELNILGQLKSGVRYFDMRVCDYENQFYTTHYYISDNYNNFLPEINTYLNSHPKELIIFDFDGHLYADSDTGYLDDSQMDKFVTLLQKNLDNHIVRTTNLPSIANKTLAKVNQLGNLLLFTSNKYLLANYSAIFFNRAEYLDSQWTNQADAGLLVKYIESNVLPSWGKPEYANKIKVLQGQITMPNDWQMQLWTKQSLLNLARKKTNPLLVKKLKNDWQKYDFNIIMTDDANNSELMQEYILPNIGK